MIDEVVSTYYRHNRWLFRTNKQYGGGLINGSIIDGMTQVFLTSQPPHIPTPLKVAFIQKGLMCLSFLQRDKPNYYPELEFWFFFILNGSNHVKYGHEAAVNAQNCVRAASSSYLTWFEQFRMKKKIIILPQENN